MKLTRVLESWCLTVIALTAFIFTTSTLPAQTTGKTSGDLVLDSENNSDLFWEEVFTVAGVDGDVYAMERDSEGNVYVGGDFTTVSGLPANNIAMWDGSAWSTLGDGANGPVYAIETIDLEVFIAGDFDRVGGSPASGVANWTGQTRWRTMGTGMTGVVYALERQGTNLVAAGNFISAGGVIANNISIWNGTRWTSLGAGLFGAGETAYAVEVVGDRIFVGGSFGRADDVPVNNIAMYENGVWSDLAGGLAKETPNATVYALEATANGVWVGGDFETSGSEQTLNVALYEYESSSWAGIQLDADLPVRAMKLHDDDELFIGGDFTTLGGNQHSRVARINLGVNPTVSGLGSGVNQRVRSILIINDDEQLFAGDFSLAGVRPAASITRWNGSSYFALSPLNNNTVDGRINSMVQLESGDIVVGGAFRLAGSIAASNIARWDGQDWFGFNGGTNGEVHDLAVGPDGRIYAAGEFTTAGVTGANRIACWDGVRWSSLGSGMDNSVYSIALDGPTVYAGGDFIRAGTTTANRVACWNGVDDWIPLAGGVDNRVTDMEFGSGRLVVVGWFQTAGIVPDVGGVAAFRLESESWLSFDPNSDGLIHGVALRDEEIYIVGNFTQLNGLNANGVGRWTGSDWAPLGTGIEGIGNQVVVDDDDLVVVGDFDGAGSVEARNIARWDGFGWIKFGSGLNGPARAVIATDDNVFAGGTFTLAGDKPSRNIAQWFVCNPDLRISANGSTRLCDGESVQLIASGNFVTYQWSTGDESQAIEIDAQGTWTVTATDARGCVAVASISTQVTQLPEPVIVDDETGLPISSTIFLCPGETVKLDAGNFNSFLWSNDARSRSIIVNQPGQYSVEVEDLNGCSAVSAVVTVERLTAPAKPTITQEENELVSSPAASYQWYFEGQLIPGATSQRFAPTVEGVYTVEITANGGDGCTARSDSFNFISTGVDQVIGNAEFSVFPNPTSDLLVVGFTPQNSGPVRIDIVNSLGNIIQSVSVEALAGQRSRIDLNIGEAADGVYFIQLNGLSNSQRLKVIKQR